MTDLEDRLREDLPALADALGADDGPPRSERDRIDPTIELSRRRGARARTPMLVAAAAVAVVVVTGLAMAIGRDTGTTITATDGVRPTDSFGTWETVPEGPIPAPSYPVSAWTGTEAVFWAGSNLERNFAYSAAAAYDPAEGSWRDVDEPGWGHPGLVGAVLDGDLYASAKGSVGRFDFDTGEWVDLPSIDGVWLQNIAAGDGTLWGLGVLDGDLDADPILSIAGYDPEEGVWRQAPATLDGPLAATASEALGDLDQPVLWTGSSVVVWDGQGGISYLPGQQRWTELPTLDAPDGTVVATRAVADDGLVVVAEVVVDQHRALRIAALDDAGRWRWGADMPAVDLDAATVTAAGEWVVVIPAVGSPITIHTPSGAWHQHADAPIQGLQGPGTVWTGTQLVVWGGVPDGDRAADGLPQGMVWSAPER